MKKKFENPELVIIYFNNEDVIRTSGEDDKWPLNPDFSEDD